MIREKRLALFYLVMAVVCLVSTIAKGGTFTGLIALEVAKQKIEVKDVVPRSECTVCKGTGKVKGGDGVTIVERVCDNCYDDGVGQTPEPVQEPEPEPVQEPEPEPVQEPEPKTKPKPTIEFYHADYCTPCKYLEPILADFKSQGYTIIDYDTQVSNPARVASIPTLILKSNGTEVRRLIGWQGNETTKAFIEVGNLMTATQLRQWAAQYTGVGAGVEGMTIIQHLTDSNATTHHGGPFQAWQLQGLTQVELEKIHDGQHTNVLTPFGSVK